MERVVLVGIALVAACSAAGQGNGFTSDDGQGGAGSSTTDGPTANVSSPSGAGVGGGFNGSSGVGGGSSGCSDATQLVYVLSIENDLYSFAPDKKIFTKIGPLQCNAGNMVPNSMAVDRNATAWVNYVASDDNTGVDTAGAVFLVSTKDASCQPTNVKLGPNWYRLGMGFSVDQPGGTSETLYVNGGTDDPMANTGPGLGKIDTKAFQFSPIGQFTQGLQGASAELTGTGDARLFGFFTTTPVVLGELDKASGAVTKKTSLPQVETPFDWAFSFWGGSFYFYTAPDTDVYPNRTTNVTKYDPQTMAIDTAYMTNIGFLIVGAGVSTCAPLTPPK